MVHRLLSDDHGYAIGQAFANNYLRSGQWSGYSYENLEILLEGPNHSDYDDAWDEVYSKAYIVRSDGIYRLYLDSHLWAMHEDYEGEPPQ